MLIRTGTGLHACLLSAHFSGLLAPASMVFFNHALLGAKKIKTQQTFPDLSDSRGLLRCLQIELEPGVGLGGAGAWTRQSLSSVTAE